jgi:alpha-glucosidase
LCRYGIDIVDLSLSVEYQSKERLAVRIVPKYLSAENQSLYILDPDLTPYPGLDDGASKAESGLRFSWSNSPSFQFKVERASSGEVLFDTSGNVIVFEDQFLELATSMVRRYTACYPCGESLTRSVLGTGL